MYSRVNPRLLAVVLVRVNSSVRAVRNVDQSLLPAEKALTGTHFYNLNRDVSETPSRCCSQHHGSSPRLRASLPLFLQRSVL